MSGGLGETKRDESFWFTKQDAQNLEDAEEVMGGLNADYWIKGAVMTVPLRLVSKYAKEHYLYIQSFGLVHADGTFYTKRKDYASYLILFTYGGRGYLQYDGREYILNPGDGFIIDCRRPHYYRTEGDCWFHSILHFNGKPMRDLEEMFTNIVLFTCTTVDWYNKMIEELLEVYTLAPVQMELQLSSGLYHLLSQIVVLVTEENRVVCETERNVNKIADYIGDHYHQQLCLDDLSCYIGLSKYHLIREFKKYKGCTPHKYLQHVRLEQAKFLLKSTTFPIAAIAQMVGILDLNNFNGLFKKYTGITPGAYRKR
jgi:AraC-like DNA-binding protein